LSCKKSAPIGIRRPDARCMHKDDDMRMRTKLGHLQIGGAAAMFALIGGMSLPAAAANPVDGWYISGVAGANFMQQESVNQIGGFKTNSVNLRPADVGGMVVLGGGYGFGNGFRTEFQFNYRYNGINGVTGPRGNTVSINNSNNSASEQKYGPMPTLYYDFYTLSPDYVPYVGVGVGYQIVKEKLNVGGFSTDTTRGTFATQAIVGVAFPLPSVPGLSVTTDYRFLATVGDRTYNRVELGNSYNHAVTIGLRYAFGAPPPPPPPIPVSSPAPAPSRSYLVFFDWDKAVLTDRARQIVSEAASNSTKVQYTRLEVNGYTDTSGTPSYNQGLSIKRAQAVAAELVKDGVPAGAIAIQGFGETHLLVPTGQGVREPQNRRVEIIIH
jgi:OOP family OmpA-OmpF porin